MITSPGIYDVPFSQYLADPCASPSLSSSIAHRLITASPLHAWQEHPKLGGVSDESKEADVGSAAHEMLLGGEDRIAWLPFDNWRTNASKDARDAARAAGQIPMLEIKQGEVLAMVEAADHFVGTTALDGIFDRGQSERTLIWKEGDVWCRCRPDFLTTDHGTVLHFKTTQASARPSKFIRGVFASMGYGFSMRFYARGLAATFQPAPPMQHLMLVQEQAAPYACSLIALTPAMAEIEDARVRVAIAMWRKCLAEDSWPGYDTRIHYADPTPWQLAEAEELAQS